MNMLELGGKGHSCLVMMGAVFLAIIISSGPKSSFAETIQEAETVIQQAGSTWQDFMQDPDLSGFRNHIKGVKALLIVPKLLKGAFMYGVEGGNGVLFIRDEKTGAWPSRLFMNCPR